MRHLDDEQLNSLLREAKSAAPVPAAGIEDRVMQAYAAQIRKSFWRRFLTGTVRVPVPVAVAAAIALVCVGAVFAVLAGGSATRTLTPPAVQHAAPGDGGRDYPALNVGGLQPVSELHPKILRRGRDLE